MLPVSTQRVCGTTAGTALKLAWEAVSIEADRIQALDMIRLLEITIVCAMFVTVG